MLNRMYRYWKMVLFQVPCQSGVNNAEISLKKRSVRLVITHSRIDVQF